MAEIDLNAVRAGLNAKVRDDFTEACAAAFRNTIGELAKRAQGLGMDFPDACSGITTGGQVAVLGLLVKFGAHESAESVVELACGVVRELAPIVYAAETEEPSQ